MYYQLDTPCPKWQETRWFCNVTVGVGGLLISASAGTWAQFPHHLHIDTVSPHRHALYTGTMHSRVTLATLGLLILAVQVGGAVELPAKVRET